MTGLHNLTAPIEKSDNEKDEYDSAGNGPINSASIQMTMTASIYALRTACPKANT